MQTQLYEIRHEARLGRGDAEVGDQRQPQSRADRRPCTAATTGVATPNNRAAAM